MTANHAHTPTMPDICHAEIVLADGHLEACNQPAVWLKTGRGYFGEPITYPVCAEHKEEK